MPAAEHAPEDAQDDARPVVPAGVMPMVAVMAPPLDVPAGAMTACAFVVTPDAVTAIMAPVTPEMTAVLEAVAPEMPAPVPLRLMPPDMLAPVPLRLMPPDMPAADVYVTAAVVMSALVTVLLVALGLGGIRRRRSPGQPDGRGRGECERSAFDPH